MNSLPLNSLARCNYDYGGCDPNAVEAAVRTFAKIFGWSVDAFLIYMLPLALVGAILFAVLWIDPLPETKTQIAKRAFYGIGVVAVVGHSSKLVNSGYLPENTGWILYLILVALLVLYSALYSSIRALRLYRNLGGSS